MVEHEFPMSPERFAKQALRAVARNRAIIVIPSWWRIVWWLNRLSPALGLYLGRKALEAMHRAAQDSRP
jgi:short-subunit dehydrogenase